MRQVDKGGGEIHPGEDAISVAQDFRAENLHSAGSRQQKAEQDREGGRFAGTVATEQRRGHTTRDAETDPVDRDGGRIAFDEIVDFDGGPEQRTYMTPCKGFGTYR